MSTPQASLKRYVESGTGFVHNLTRDKFVRTEGAVIGILFLLCIIYVAIVSVASYYLHLAIAGQVVSSVSEAIATNNYNATSSTATLLSSIADIRFQYLSIIIGTCLIATLLFGYIAARLVLSPTRNALASQKQFIGKIAHELRTPLAIITANHEITLQEYKNDPNLLELSNSNLEELNRIRDIISNLLTLNTLTNTESLVFEVVDLGHIFEKLNEAYTEQAVPKHITFTSDIASDMFVAANRGAMGQIMSNLIKNAIAYTPEGGMTHVKIHAPNPNFVRFSVQDNGIGIAQDQIKKIFHPFYRAGTKKSRAPGSGLGLSIVQELVDLHGGSIAIESALGVGTTISIDFPRYLPPLASRDG